MTTFDYVLVYGVVLALFVSGVALVVRGSWPSVRELVCRVRRHRFSGWSVHYELVSVVGSAADGLLLQVPRAARPACRRCGAPRPGSVGVDLRRVNVAADMRPASE